MLAGLGQGLRGLASGIVADATRSAERLAWRVALALAGLVAIGVAVGFLTALVHGAIAFRYGTAMAHVAVGGFFMAAGLVLLFLATLRTRRLPAARPVVAPRLTERPPVAAAASSSYPGAAGEPVPLPTLAAAFAAGFAQGLFRR